MPGYNQNISSFWKALLSVLLFVALLGALAAGAITYGHTPMNEAEATRLQSNTAWDARVREMELPFIQSELEREARVSEAETQSRLAQVEMENQAHRMELQEQYRLLVERNNQQLLTTEKWQTVIMILTLALGFAISISIAIVLPKALLLLVNQKMGQTTIARGHSTSPTAQSSHIGQAEVNGISKNRERNTNGKVTNSAIAQGAQRETRPSA